MYEDILEKVEVIVSPILENLGYQLIEKELVVLGGQLTLRLYIDKEGEKVSVSDCERASHAIEDVLDAEGVIDTSYNLEVSSPGMDRPLRRIEDFEKQIGKIVRIKTKEPIEGRMNYKGVLEAVREGEVFVLIDGIVYRVPVVKIAKAKLVPDF